MIKKIKNKVNILNNYGILTWEDKSLEKSIVVKHNKLIEARYNLSINEQRVLIYLLSKIDFSKQDLSNVEISASNIADTFGLNKCGTMFEGIENACKKLFNYAIDISQEEGKEDWVHWFIRIRYKRGSGIITAEFHPELKPYVIALQSHYTKYKLAAVAKFRSQYSVRIYELLKMHQYKVTNGVFYKILRVEEIRKMLGIKDHEYKLFPDFEKRVTKVAQAEINALSDLFILDIERIKTGRKTTELKFICQIKDEKVIENTLIPQDIDEIPIRKKVEDDLKALGIPKYNINIWLSEYKATHIQRNLTYTMEQYKKGQVKSLPAYLAKAIQNDYANVLQMTKYIEQQKLEQKALKAKEEEEKLKAQHEKERQLAKQQEQETLAIFNALNNEQQQKIASEALVDFPGIQQQYKKHGLESNMAKCMIISHFKNNSI